VGDVRVVVCVCGVQPLVARSLVHVCPSVCLPACMHVPVSVCTCASAWHQNVRVPLLSALERARVKFALSTPLLTIALCVGPVLRPPSCNLESCLKGEKKVPVAVSNVAQETLSLKHPPPPPPPPPQLPHHITTTTSLTPTIPNRNNSAPPPPSSTSPS
jgi:hypothetical protein